MRFSFWPASTNSFDDVLSLGAHIERSGWDGMWLADHFMPNAEDTSAPYLEGWTALSALAATVPRVRLGTLVTGNTYRHPAVLAKMAATVDHISKGRLVLGLGAGWQENEHQQYGLEFSTIPGRLARLEEACQVIRSLFEHERADFQGKYYQLDSATLEPKPVQPNLPILIGGGGEKVTLRITAQWADEWNVWGTVDRLIQKMAVLDGHCDSINRDPGEIQRSAVALLFLSDDSSYIERIREKSQQPVIAGSISEVQDIVRAYGEAGVDELIVPDFNMKPGQEKLDLLDTFINDIAPAAS